MGARSVVALGRKEAVLSDLKRRFGDRLVPVQLVGNADYDSEAMKHAAPAPIDTVFDFLPPSAKARVARTAIMTVRPYIKCGFLKTRAILPHAASTHAAPTLVQVRPTKRRAKTKAQTLAYSVAC
jgi:hypothetical protein